MFKSKIQGVPIKICPTLATAICCPLSLFISISISHAIPLLSLLPSLVPSHLHELKNPIGSLTNPKVAFYNHSLCYSIFSYIKSFIF